MHYAHQVPTNNLLTNECPAWISTMYPFLDLLAEKLKAQCNWNSQQFKSHTCIV